MKNERALLTPVATEQAPRAIGPYSQAIVAETGGNRLVFLSGQIALSPSTGTLVGAGDVRAEAEQVMQNLGAVLAAAGCRFADVVKA
ncbi:Rid family hydrolase, partial [Haliangium sp. UPWRP_2]|uniref:Rid family hydrolase n=1 Tax=Haliangium sp. UPWRP_2 TaxID=1931276 RepID=UPI002100D08B